MNNQGFIFLTDAIFSEISNFTEGFGDVVKTDYITGGEFLRNGTPKPLYITHSGETFDKEKYSADKLTKKIFTRENPTLVPFQQNNLWGYRNNNNEIIIAPRFEAAREFVNGFAKVALRRYFGKEYNINWGLISSTGEIVLPAEFIEIGEVYNNIVWYKKYVYFEWQYYNGFDYNMKEKRKSVTLYGYLSFSELDPEIEKLENQLARANKILNNVEIRREIELVQMKIISIKEKLEHIKKIKNELST